MPWDNLNLGAESCCACPTLVCVYARCGTAAVSGASVEIRAAADPPHSGALLGSGATNASGGFCATIENEGNVDVLVEKDGYHAVELTNEAVPCSTGRTFAVDLCPTQITLKFWATSCGGGVCHIPDTIIEIAGDLTGELTTTGSFWGDSITLNTPDPAGGDCTLALTLTATPPEGHGMEAQTITREFLACSPDYARSVGFNLLPVPGTTGRAMLAGGPWPPSQSPQGCCSGRYLADTVQYSDDYGSATLTYGIGYFGAGYKGTYNRHSGATIKKVADPYGAMECRCGQAGEVRIEVFLSFGGDSCAGAAPKWTLWHLFPAGGPCGPGVAQMISDPACYALRFKSPHAYAPGFEQAYGEIEHACAGGPINLTIPFTGPWEDTSGTATITGAAV